MDKRFSVFLIAVIASILMFSSIANFGTAQAGPFIPKPTVPEFTVKLIDSSYDVPPSSSVNPYTGQTETQPSYHVESRTIKLSIKNQPFTSYQINENGNNWTIDFYYTILWKGHFEQDWHEYSVDGFLRAELESEYTVLSFEGEYSSTEGLKLTEYQGMSGTFPPGAQVDFKVKAMIGYLHYETPVFGGWVFTGETSESSTQTLTISANAPAPSPDDGTPPDGGTQQVETSSFIFGVAVTTMVAAVVVAAGLLLTRRKRHGEAAHA